MFKNIDFPDKLNRPPTHKVWTGYRDIYET